MQSKNPKVKKQLGLYEIENIDNANLCTTVVNPKEYFEKFKEKVINKKHKEVIQIFRGMNFESYTGKITPLREVDSEKKEKKIIQKQLKVHNTEIKMARVSKV